DAVWAATSAWRSSHPPKLAVGAIHNVLRTIGEPEVWRHGEQRSVGFGAHEIGEFEGLLAHARIAALAGDDGLEVGRSPDFSHDHDGLIVADRSGGNRARCAYSGDDDALHGLSAKVFGGRLTLSLSKQLVKGHRGNRAVAWAHRSPGGHVNGTCSVKAGSRPCRRHGKCDASLRNAATCSRR